MSKEAMSVGPMKWKHATIKSVQESDKLTRRADLSCSASRTYDLQPGTRKILTDLSNQKANQQGRSLRQITNAMRETIIDLNIHIRSMNRTSDLLEKLRIEVEKDIKKNNQSNFLRDARPKREKTAADDADLLLRNEQKSLRDIKKSVDSRQTRVNESADQLANLRKILTTYLDRKSKLLDLVPDSTLSQRPLESGKSYSSLSLGRSSSGLRLSSGSYSSLSLSFESQEFDEHQEISNIIRDALDEMERSKALKQEIDTFMRMINEERKQTVDVVNTALQAKIQETRHLQKELKSAIGRNRQVASKSIKTYHDTQYSWLDLKGPESAKHMTLQERMDRPLMRAYQGRSTATLPETVEQIKGSDKLLSSLRQTAQNIGMLKMAEMKLQGDAVDKNAALRVDRQVTILRKKKHLD